MKSMDRSRGGGGGRREGNMDRGGSSAAKIRNRGVGGGKNGWRIPFHGSFLLDSWSGLAEKEGMEGGWMEEGTSGRRGVTRRFARSASRRESWRRGWPMPTTKARRRASRGLCAATSTYTWTRARCESSRCEMHATLHLRYRPTCLPDHAHDLPLLSPFRPRRSIIPRSLSIKPTPFEP